MTRTFRDYELREQRLAANKRRQQRRLRQVDPFCAYMLGILDEQGSHAQAVEPADRAFHIARRIMQEG